MADADITLYPVGTVLRGFGLLNAGHYYTVKAVDAARQRMQVESHRTGLTFWTPGTYMQPDERGTT